VGLVGTCLAGLAFAGCDNTPVRPGGSKTDMPPISSSSGNPSWNNSRQGQSGTAGGSFAGGSGGASVPATTITSTPLPRDSSAGAGPGSNGAFNVGAGGSSDGYPNGRSMDSATGAGGGNILRVSSSGSPGPDLTGGRTTQPPAPSTNFNDPKSGSVPVLVGSPPASAGATSRLPALPPMVAQPGAPRPAMDVLTSTGEKVRVIAPVGSTSGGGDMSEVAGPAIPLPPPAPPVGLPTIPLPQSPDSSTTAAPLAKPLPPIAPALPSSGIPTRPQNPAVMGSGTPSE